VLEQLGEFIIVETAGLSHLLDQLRQRIGLNRRPGLVLFLGAVVDLGSGDELTSRRPKRRAFVSQDANSAKHLKYVNKVFVLPTRGGWPIFCRIPPVTPAN
jgi:hypothetical protein